ncbi:unknown [Clostridium sp. CAG:768]|nr:unknown [Clostridium sp. CAG:768]
MKQKLLLILGLLVIFTAVPVKSEDYVEALDNTTPLPVEEVKLPEKSPEVVKPLVLPPKWTDFCETGYENAVYTSRDDIFNVFTFVKAERVKKNYWAERRASFESYLKSCNALADDASKSACYSELRKSEEQKNDLYKLKRKQLLYENNIELNRR